MAVIEIKKYTDLNTGIKNQLNCLIEEEFGHIPIVKEIQWATPDWTITYMLNNEIVTFYNIVERTIKIDNESLNAAGINNVITPKEYRGKGFSTQAMKETEDFIFDKLKCDLGLLLCADSLLPFYSRLDWYKVDCPVYFDQPNGRKLWAANTMLLSRKKKYNPVEIDLSGYPW